MPHVFISYSSKDSEIAKRLHYFLACAGAEPFLAEISVTPGAKWKEDILENLRQSTWVFFLATPNSCQSQPVAHELGASLALKKKIIPIMWNVTAESLPVWVDDTQAVDIRDAPRVAQLIRNIGNTIKSDKFWTGIVVGGLIALGIWGISKT